MFNCDVCGKEQEDVGSLRTLQVRDTEHNAIWTYVACNQGCADKVRNQEQQAMLTDEPASMNDIISNW